MILVKIETETLLTLSINCWETNDSASFWLLDISIGLNKNKSGFVLFLIRYWKSIEIKIVTETFLMLGIDCWDRIESFRFWSCHDNICLNKVTSGLGLFLRFQHLILIKIETKTLLMLGIAQPRKNQQSQFLVMTSQYLSQQV